MTLSGPSIPSAVASATETRLLTIDDLDLHLIAGSAFDAVADAVGQLRESTYRKQNEGRVTALANRLERVRLRACD